MLICGLCQGFGLHKAAALYMQQELKIYSRGAQSTYGENTLLLWRNASRSQGSPQAVGPQQLSAVQPECVEPRHKEMPGFGGTAASLQPA